MVGTWVGLMGTTKVATSDELLVALMVDVMDMMMV